MPQYNVPVPTDRPGEQQGKLEAVKHWDIVARDAAAQIHQELAQRNLLNVPLNVKHPEHHSAFSQGLHELTLSHLVAKGAHVVRDGSGKLDLEHNLQVVRFNAARGNRSEPRYLPGSITALAAGVLVAHNAATLWNPANQKAAALGMAAITDAFQSTFGPTHADSWRAIPNLEIMINTSLIQGNAFITRRSDIYYINEPDAHQFSNRLKIRGCEAGKAC